MHQGVVRLSGPARAGAAGHDVRRRAVPCRTSRRSGHGHEAKASRPGTALLVGWLAALWPLNGHPVKGMATVVPVAGGRRRLTARLCGGAVGGLASPVIERRSEREVEHSLYNLKDIVGHH